MHLFHLLFVAAPAMLLVNTIHAAPNPSPSWKDSYSVGDQCYCESTYDHGLNKLNVQTPQGVKSVIEVCETIGPGPGSNGHPGYNDIQCGNGPANNAGDEDPGVCPGRIDMGPSGCLITGPTWNLERFFPADNTPDESSTDPATQPEPDPAPEPDSGGESTDSSDAGTGTDELNNTTTEPRPTSGQINGSNTPIRINPDTVNHIVGSHRFWVADVRWVEMNPDTNLDYDDYWTDPDGNQSATAANQTYLELLPDHRVTASDTPTGESDWAVPGEGPMVSYQIDFGSAGRYAVAVRSYSSGTQDRGVFVGLNNHWPLEGRLILHCGPNSHWSWTDCRGAHEAWVDVPAPGVHTLVMSGYADGFQFDQISLTRFEPSLQAGLPVRTGQRDFLPATAGMGSELLLLVPLLALRRQQRR